jgi:ATP-dependent DNA helicase RecQ
LPAICAGYFTGDILFDVSGLEGQPAPVAGYIANTFAILTRGAPTRPSSKLRDMLVPDRRRHGSEWDALFTDPLLLVNDARRDWRQSIKGAPDGYNPALEFFEAILPIQLREWGFVQQLIIPEYPLFRRLGGSGNVTSGPNDEQVDFYLPQADLVIEIDGGPHREQRQAWKDRDRVRYLALFGILTLRLATSDLRAENKAFLDFFARLRKRLEDSAALRPYRAFVAARKHSAPSLRLELTAIIRLQIAILLAISHRQLDPAAAEWRLNLSQDFVSRPGADWPTIAVAELFDWFDLFACLSHSSFQAPNLVLSADGLQIDLRLFSRADDETETHGGICIRTSGVQDLPFALDTKQPPTLTRLQDLGISYLARQDDCEAPPPPLTADLTELCRRVFGHEEFRPGQEALIYNALSGQKTLGLMPTGGGKSLCFQLPALLQAGTTVTVVPIKALGRDHCAELEAAGFTGRVINIDSDMPARLRDHVQNESIPRGQMRFVFVSPERFQSEGFRDTVRKLRGRRQMRMFVIDEVHCMSEWGHDFRPAYLTLPGTLRELADEVPVMGLTATASVNVLRDIQGEFQIPDEMVAYEMHRSRSELSFSVRKELSTAGQIETELEKIQASAPGNQPPPTHVFARYANGVLGVETYATMLGNSRLGLRVGSFSGSTPEKFSVDTAFGRLKNPTAPRPESHEDYKKTVQALWKTGNLDVIVTTKAFGMGVNKPDVRHTLHAGMPGSMEAFYQEAGRAGRDRKPAFCGLLLRPEPDNAELVHTRLQKDLTPSAIKIAMETTSDGKQLGKNSRGDFRAQLWFLSQGLISVEEERALVARAHEVLRKADGNKVAIKADQFSEVLHGDKRLQQTLYRLYQMGLIGPWSVTDWGRDNGENSSVQAVEVPRLQTTFAESCGFVIERIVAIEGLAAKLPELDQVRRLEHSSEDWPALYQALLSWVRRKHLDSRLQSTWNLYAQSMAFTPERADAFREELEAFFKVDNNAFQLAALRDMAQKEVLPSLMGLLHSPGTKQLKERSALRKLSAQLARLLEGTQDSPGLNLAAASLLLLTEDKPGAEATMRFRAAATEGALGFRRSEGGKALLGLLATSSVPARDLIGDWLLAENPNRDELLDIQEQIPAHAIEAALFKELASELAETI